MHESDHRLRAILTQPDRPAGRGKRPRASPVKQQALAYEIPVYQPESLASLDTVRFLEEISPDLMVVVAYGLILPARVLAIPAHGCINVHASLLPRWRGAAPIQRAILAGDEITGITIMQMEDGLDTGPVLARHEIPIGREDTAADLHDRLASLGAGLLVEVVDSIASEKPLHAEVQDNSLATYADKLDKSEARIDWSLGAEELERRVRAYNPWPVAFSSLGNQPLKVWRARALPGIDCQTAGRIESVAEDGIAVCTGRGLLVLQEVQPAGKRRMTSRDYLLSRPHIVPGLHFGR